LAGEVVTPKRLRYNRTLLLKLLTSVVLMFGFGYALVPLYRAICELTGINVLALGEVDRSLRGNVQNTQVDQSRTITVVFDTNARGPWLFKPEVRSMDIHPGQLNTVVYEFENVQPRSLSAQAIPSYAPKQAAAHFNKLECFCFTQHTLAPGEKKSWPVVFIVDPKLSKDVKTITLSYTFFEVGSGVNPEKATGVRAQGDAG
jgi:cytochrome c oxidase assembly protein subunit 11